MTDHEVSDRQRANGAEQLDIHGQWVVDSYRNDQERGDIDSTPGTFGILGALYDFTEHSGVEFANGDPVALLRLAYSPIVTSQHCSSE